MTQSAFDKWLYEWNQWRAGLKRDDSGNVAASPEIVDGWEIIENPPPDMVVQHGDEAWSLAGSYWFKIAHKSGNTLDDVFGEMPIRIRRRVQLPADSSGSWHGKLAYLIADQSQWSQATFGSDKERGPIGALKHLDKWQFDDNGQPCGVEL